MDVDVRAAGLGSFSLWFSHVGRGAPKVVRERLLHPQLSHRRKRLLAKRGKRWHIDESSSPSVGL